MAAVKSGREYAEEQAQLGSDTRSRGTAAADLARILLRSPLTPFIVPAFLAIVWEVTARAHLLSSSLFPSLSGVFAVGADWLFHINGLARSYSGTWIHHATASTERVLTGFCIGALTGLVLGVVVGWWSTGKQLLDPMIQGLRPIPVTAWVPLAIIWLGIGTAPAVFLVVIGAFFPTYVNTVHGVSQVGDRLIQAAQMLGANRRQILFRVVLEAALPTIITGMRVGLGFAWMCVIVSEMLAVKSGIGYVLWDSYYFANLDMVVAAMISVGLLGYASDRLFCWLVRRKIMWADQSWSS